MISGIGSNETNATFDRGATCQFSLRLFSYFVSNFNDIQLEKEEKSNNW